MELSEKQLNKVKELFQKSCFLDGNEIKLYGRICRLEGLLELAKEYKDEISVSNILIKKYTEELNEIAKYQ